MRKIGETTTLSQAWLDWANVQAPSKTQERKNGLAFDRQEKEHLRDKYGCTISPGTYDPYDVALDGGFFDIKLVQADTITVSPDEYVFGVRTSATGGEYGLLVYTLDGETVTFRGVLSMSDFREHMSASQFPDKDGRYGRFSRYEAIVDLLKEYCDA